jgi:tetratricopeptide (TPR) repeat protein
MVSFGVQPAHGVKAGILVLAVVTPCASFSQAVLERAASDQQREIVEKIQQAQQQNGEQSADLIGPWTALGLLYQEEGDHHLAVAAIERARQTVRANYGLHSLDQAPLMWQMIHSEEATGDLAAARELEQELLTLAKRNPDDLRTVPILRKIGDRRMDVLRRYESGELAPEVILGCYYNPARDPFRTCHAGSRGVVIRSILAEAWGFYAGAINTMLQHGLYSSDELHELEMELVRISYVYGGDPVIARQALRRLLAYDVEDGAPLLTRMNAVVQIADWDLLYAEGLKSKDLALEMYQEAYETLKQGGIAQASIEQIFAPETPVAIPAFLPNVLGSGDAQDSTGYIDVSFAVTKYGDSEEIEILEATAGATDDAKDSVVRLIARSRFRPRLSDGRFPGKSSFVVRYYLKE